MRLQDKFRPGSTPLLVFLAGGTLATFSVFGLAQEKVTSQYFGEERFHYTTVLVLLQSLGNACLAACILLGGGALNGSSNANEASTKKDLEGTGSNSASPARGHDWTSPSLFSRLQGDVPHRSWALAALGYFVAHQCGLNALRFIPFPMQVIFKSCKVVPVMIGEVVVAKVSHPLHKQIAVFFMVVGVLLFTAAGKSRGGKSESGADGGPANWDFAVGVALIIGALMADGWYGPVQNRIAAEHPHVTAWHLMFNMNIYQGAISLVTAVATGELATSLGFFARHPQIFPVIGAYVLCMGCGNAFLYNLQRHFGALMVTMTTTLRKLLSVLFSVLAFGHVITTPQWCGGALVFGAPFLGKRIANWWARKQE